MAMILILLAGTGYFSYFIFENWGNIHDKYFSKAGNGVLAEAGKAEKAKEKCLQAGGEILSLSDEKGYYKICHFADGGECEMMSFYATTCLAKDSASFKEGSQEIAYNWVEYNSPSYSSGGYDLTLKEAKTMRCPYCYQFTFTFASRTGNAPKTNDKNGSRTISVAMERGVVEKVILDDRINEYIRSEDVEDKRTKAIYEGIDPVFFVFEPGNIGKGWFKIGEANNRLYVGFYLESVELPSDKKYANAWLASAKDKNKYYQIGPMAYDQSQGAYKKDLILPIGKKEFSQAYISFESERSPAIPSQIIASSKYEKIEKINID